MEIAGATAMWTRPDTGDCPVSYPAPTYSAVRNIFQSILWGQAVTIMPRTFARRSSSILTIRTTAGRCGLQINSVTETTINCSPQY